MKYYSAIALAAALALANPVLAQNAEAGKTVFKKCAACHRVGPGAKNAAGPVLNNVIGRPAGSYAGYKYGKGMIEASGKGLVWDADKIAEYITDPKKYLRAFTGNKKAKAKMRFKLKDAQQRADVVAYIATFSKMEAMMEEEETDRGGGMSMAPMDVPQNAVCVQNTDKESYFFAVDGGGDSRKTGQLAPGESLCTAALEMATKGKVSVFETADTLEGCTRITQLGTVEEMRKYADFDRCLWSSNDS